MVDLLVSLVLVTVGLVVVLLAAGAFTVLPVMLTVDRAEKVGLNPDVWGALAVLGVLVSLLLVLALPAHGFFLPLALSYALVGAAHVFAVPGTRGAGAHR